MSTSIMKEFFNRTELQASKNPNRWSIVKIESLLDEVVGVFDYEIFKEERLVSVCSRGDIVRMLLYLVPYELSSECGITLSKVDNRLSMQIGSWRFEAKA